MRWWYEFYMWVLVVSVVLALMRMIYVLNHKDKNSLFWKDELAFNTFAYLLFGTAGFIMSVKTGEDAFAPRSVSEWIGYHAGACLWFAFVWFIAMVISFSATIITTIQEKKLKKTEDRLFALDEIKSGSVDESVWCEALIAAHGDEDRAKAKYLQIRRKNRSPEKFNNRFLAFFYILGIIFILIYGVIFLAIAYALMFL